MKTTRTYTMTTRAEAAERTRVGILDAMVGLATSRMLVDISLDDVASAAGVSVQTVLRRFGSRAGLVDAAYRPRRGRGGDRAAGARRATWTLPWLRSSSTTSGGATASC